MRAISLKMDEKTLDEIDSTIKSKRYSTRTEFIRDAIREKLSQLEKQEILKNIEEIHRHSDKKTTDEELHKTREKLAEELTP